MENKIKSIDDYIQESKAMESSSQGGSPSYHFGDVVLVKYTGQAGRGHTRPDAEMVAREANKKNAQGVRTPAHLAIKREIEGDREICWVLQEAAKGKIFTLDAVRLDAIKNAPDAHYERFVSDVCALKHLGLELKPKNIFYDSHKLFGGFTIIDLLNAGTPFDNSTKDVLEVFSLCRYPVGWEAAEKIFKAMEKVIPNFEKHRRYVLRSMPDDVLKSFSENGIFVGDLTLNEEEQKQFDATKEQILHDGMEKLKTGELTYSQIEANEIRIALKHNGMQDSWRHHPQNSINRKDFQNDAAYSRACEKNLEADLNQEFNVMLDKLIANTPTLSPALLAAKTELHEKRNPDIARQRSEEFRNLASLWNAISRGDLERIHAVVKSDPGVVNRQLPFNGSFPMQMAMQANNAEAAIFILRHKPNLLLKDAENKTIMDYLDCLSSEKLKAKIASVYQAQFQSILVRQRS